MNVHCATYVFVNIVIMYDVKSAVAHVEIAYTYCSRELLFRMYLHWRSSDAKRLAANKVQEIILQLPAFELSQVYMRSNAWVKNG